MTIAKLDTPDRPGLSQVWPATLSRKLRKSSIALQLPIQAALLEGVDANRVRRTEMPSIGTPGVTIFHISPAFRRLQLIDRRSILGSIPTSRASGCGQGGGDVKSHEA